MQDFLIESGSGYANIQTATRHSSVTPYTALMLPVSFLDVRVLAGDSS